MKLYVCMVLSGSIGTLLYMIFNRILSCEMPLKWRSLFLRANILFYLLPVPWFTAQLRACAKWLLEKAGMVFPEVSRTYVVNMDNMWDSFLVLNEEGKIVYVTGYRKWLWLIVAASILFLLLIVAWMILYWRICSQYIHHAERVDDNQYIKSEKNRRRVRVEYSPGVFSPVTLGIFHPVILLPSDREWYLDSYEEIVLHELKHVSCMDVF